MKAQAKKSIKAEIHDPQKGGLLSHGFRQKMVEYYEKLPGRDSDR
jgi:pyruvate dehydrogenase (quinone)